MTKKIIAMLLALALCLSLAVTVSAAPAEFVIDELDVISAETLEELNGYAADILAQTGVGVFFAYTTADSLVEYDVDTLVGGLTDYLVMVENEDSWYSFAGGKGESADITLLREEYDTTETYADGVKVYLEAAKQCFPVTETAPEGTEPITATGEQTEYLVFDEAQLLTYDEMATLEAKLQSIGRKYNVQLTVCTTSTIDGADIDEYADGLYDYMTFGYGAELSGIMVLVCMDIREVCVFSNASVSADDRDAIRKAMTPALSDGNYAEAFDTYADKCAYYLEGMVNGFPFDTGKNLIICLLIGIVAGVIVAFALKGQLKSVRKQNQANVYVRPGSMQVNVHNDFFLYRTVTRSQKSSGSSSGSSSRGSSSGSF
jgi:uncharacterized protein